MLAWFFFIFFRWFADGFRSPPGAAGTFRRRLGTARRSVEEEEEVMGVSNSFLSSCRIWLNSCTVCRVNSELVIEEDARFVARKMLNDADARLVDILKRGKSWTEDKSTALSLARIASWFDEPYVRPLDDWDGDERSLAAHLFEKYDDVPGPLKGALAHDVNDEVSLKFCRAYEEVGAGKMSVRDAVRKHVSDSLTKKAAAALCAEKEVAVEDPSPLKALRRAQIKAIGGEAWIGDALASSSNCATRISTDEHFLTTDAFPWIVKYAEEVEGPHVLSLAVDFFDEMRRGDPKYSCSGRTPKTVAHAMDAYAATTVVFDDDEAFYPNPRGVRPLFVENAVIPKGTVVEVPYDATYAGGHGPYKLGPGTKRGAEEDCTLRVEEILSLKRLIYEGSKLDNCLEDRRESQLKYVMRARQRFSSFWSFTFTKNDEVKHALLLEIWHLQQGDIVRQAEGPRPRTIPSPEAWYWMKKWCEMNDVDWTTWDIYSRLGHIYPCDPL